MKCVLINGVLALFFLGSVVASPLPGPQEKRFALVIGNSRYPQSIGELANPVNDAQDMAGLLKSLNFEVILITNATYAQMRDGVKQFYDKLFNGPKDQTVGLFYYAGHGLQYQNENYLVPVDASVQYEDDIVRMCFPMQRMVLNNMEMSNASMNIVILDACRNNPFPATHRSLGGGLAEIQRAKGSFIAYATAPGSVAADGVGGRNGLYTQELLRALSIPGIPIEQTFKIVRRNVLRLSGEKQYTWDSSNILGDFYFTYPEPALVAAQPTQTAVTPAVQTEVLPAPAPAKEVVSAQALSEELTKLTSAQIPFATRSAAREAILKYFVVPHAFVNIMMNNRIDERITARKLVDRLVTLPETSVKVLTFEVADSGRIIELSIEIIEE